MKKGIILTLITLAFGVSAQAQQDTLWSQIYGGDRGDWGNGVCQTPDGGYILTGIYDANLFQINQYLYAAKTDPTGVLEWEQIIHSEIPDTSFIGRDVVLTDDGGYVIVGDVMNLYLGISLVYLLKLDQAGNLLWERTYTHNCVGEGSRGEAVKQTSDGGFIIAGSTIFDGAVEGDFYIIKTDSEGNEEWSAEYGGAGIEFAYGVVQADDGGYVAIGRTSTYATGYTDVWVLKTDPAGQQEWALNFGGGGEDEEGCDVVKTADGCFVVTGYTYAFEPLFESSAFLAKIDPDGTMLWFQDLAGTAGYSLDLTEDGGFIVVGVDEDLTTRDMYMAGADAEGNLLWAETLGDQQHWEVPYSVTSTDDGSFVVCGSYSTYFPFSDDVFLTKYGEITPADLTLDAAPYNPPIVIPSSGGSFDFNLAVTNNDPVAASFEVWTMATVPGGAQYGPLFLRSGVTLPAGGSMDRDFTQNVPANAPKGAYTFDAYAGYYPDDVWAEDHFDFSKSPEMAELGGIADWNCWTIDENDFSAAGEASLPATVQLTGTYPNPFNPVTTIAFALPQQARVTLTVYDISGRSVATLVDGYRSAGSHQVTFDASALASGIYLYRITAADFTASGKLVLLK